MKQNILHQSITTFLKHLQHERQLSPHTLNNYERDLLGAETFFTKLKISNWTEIDEKNIRSLLIQNRQKGLSARTINRQLSSLRTFFRYLSKNQQAISSTLFTVPSLKTARALPKALDVDQMSKLLEFKATDPLTIRDLALTELLYSAGLRVSEVVSLNVDDLDLLQQQATVLGKGKKTRLALIGRMALQTLQHWLSIRGTLAKPDENSVFVNKNGRRLTTRAVQYRIRQMGYKQGIDSQVSPHRLRHSFASHLLESSQDLRSVQELLGHSDLKTTQIYTKINFQHLATVYDHCHPRARKQRKDDDT